MITIIFFIVLSFCLIGLSLYAAYGQIKLAAISLAVVAWIFALTAAAIGIDYGRIRGLVDSGKYEIVTNEDYSLKELEAFKRVGDVYLKEID